MPIYTSKESGSNTGYQKKKGGGGEITYFYKKLLQTSEVLVLKYLIIYQYINLFAHRCQGVKWKQCIRCSHMFPEPLPTCKIESLPVDEFTF